jgi:hypothetical protein
LKPVASAVTLACVCALAPRTALATGSEELPGGWFVLPGINLSASKMGRHLDHDGFVDSDFAPVAGFEVSFVHGQLNHYFTWSRRDVWMGGYVDAVRDFGSERFRVSVGPELAMMFFGFDVAFVAEPGGDETRYGINGRVFLALAYASLYLRKGYFPTGNEAYDEFGLLLKLPIGLSERGCVWTLCITGGDPSSK